MIIKTRVTLAVFAHLVNDVLPKLRVSRLEIDEKYRLRIEDVNKTFEIIKKDEGQMLEVVEVLRASYDTKTGLQNIEIKVLEEISPLKELESYPKLRVPVRIMHELLDALFGEKAA